MILLQGRGDTAAELPLALEDARLYFQDVPAFLRKIDAVDEVKPLSRPGAYLVTHHAVGGLGYMVRMVACMQADWDAGGMILRPLDFDLDRLAPGDYPAVKGMVQADLRLSAPVPDRTAAAFGFSLTVELPIPSMLRLVPRSLVQATGDGIMSFQTGLTVQGLFNKVMADFRLDGVGALT
ncbi:MAG: DUF1997 domain-containing protein [Candidatus Sericytochromatia bacterium]